MWGGLSTSVGKWAAVTSRGKQQDAVAAMHGAVAAAAVRHVSHVRHVPC